MCYILLVCLSCIFLNASAIGQPPPQLDQGTSSPNQKIEPSPKALDDSPQSVVSPLPDAAPKKKRLSFLQGIVIAPLPISSPAIGSGIIPVAGYIFRVGTKDNLAPPSFVGAAGLVTNNGSRAFAVGAQLYVKENSYRITTVFVRGNINYDIYGTGASAALKLPLVQTGQIFFGEFLRRVGWKFFAGPRFVTGRSFVTVGPTSDSSFPIPPEIGFHTNLTAIGAQLTRDTSPNRFYPTSGSYFSLTTDFYSKSLGSQYSYQSYRTRFDKYWGLGKDQVLAYDGYLCATGGSPPFYGNCIYGTNNELRGYTAGRYFTRYAVATQLEYRAVLPKRFGLVAFGGAGEVIPGASQLLEQKKFLPAGGWGLRFQLSKKYHVNLRADIAQGRDGHTFSMGLGEAF
jgi:outer membrane protein assembly factor BamA